MEDNGDLKCYCIFCRSGSEKDVAQRIKILDSRVTAIAPVRVIHEKRKGKWEQHEKTLLPGYVFLYSDYEIIIDRRPENPCFYKMLRYEAEFRELQGKDHEYSMWVFRHHGKLSASSVLTEGKSVKVIEGPLLDGIGTIIKLDKHKRRVWVEFEFDGQKRVVSLGAVCVTVE